MDGMLFYKNYESAGDMMAFMLCVIIYLLLRSTYIVKKNNLHVFKAMNLLIGIASVTSLGFHTLIDYISPHNVFFIYLFRVATYVCLIGTYASICVYIKNLVEMSERYQKVFRFSIYGVGFIFAGIQILSPLLKWGFYIDENLVIHQQAYADVFTYVSVYYSANIMILLITYRKKFIEKIFLSLCTIMAISSGVLILQSFFGQTSYTIACFAFPVLNMLFLFHYNSYDVETGTLDRYAFREYIKEMKGEYSLIYLSLPGISSDKLKSFSKAFLRKNDSFFESSCCFRLKDNSMVLVYQKDRNKDFQEIMDRLYIEFLKAKENCDYRIILMDSNPQILDGQEYVAFFKFMENRTPINTTQTCGEEDVKNFIKYKYIYENLEDIFEKDDLNDPRVRVFCQPVLNTKTNVFSTAEALMRLELPEIGMVYPDQFIHIAEEYDFIHTLSKIILNKTCKNIKDLEDEGYYIERVSVNFSVQELHLETFCSDIVEIIEKNQIDSQKIAIELTETKNEKDFLNMKDVINVLQQKGIKFYLDDFGTGYSNFERIIGLPIDIIKFDRSLTILASKNDESKFMVGSFSEIFKKAEYQILFEGVEDENDESQCINMNAEYLQGYKYSKPIPIEQLKDFLEKR